MTERPRLKDHPAGRARLPTDPLEALRELTQILGGSRTSINTFFGKIPAQNNPAALARNVKSRKTKRRKSR